MLTQVQRAASWTRSLPIAQAISAVRAVATHLLNVVEAQAASLLAPRSAVSSLAFAGAQSLPAPLKRVASGRSLASPQHATLQRAVGYLLVLFQAASVTEVRTIKHALALVIAGVVRLFRNVLPKTFALTLAEAWSPVLRNVGAPLPVSSVESTTLRRFIAHPLTIVSAAVVTLGKLALLPLLLVAVGVLSLSRMVVNALSINSAEIATLAKHLVRGAFTVAQAQAVTLTRKFGHVLVAVLTEALALLKTYAKRPAVTSPSVVVVTRLVAHLISLTSAAAVALTFGVANKVFAIAQGSAYTLRRSIARAIALSQLGSVLNQSNVLKPLVSIASSVRVTLGRVAAKPFVIAQAQVLRISRGKALLIATFQAVTEGAANSRIFVAASGSMVAVGRAGSHFIGLATGSAVITVKAITTALLSTMIGSAASLITSIGRAVALTLITPFSITLSRFMQRLLTAVQAQAAALARASGHGVLVLQRQAIALPRMVVRSITILSATAATVLRQTRHFMAVAQASVATSLLVILRATFLVLALGQGMFLTKRGQRLVLIASVEAFSLLRSSVRNLMVVSGLVTTITRQTFHIIATHITQTDNLIRQHIYPRVFLAPLSLLARLNFGRFFSLHVRSAEAIFIVRQFGKIYPFAQREALTLRRAVSSHLLTAFQQSFGLVRAAGTGVIAPISQSIELLSIRSLLISLVSTRVVALVLQAAHLAVLLLALPTRVLTTKAVRPHFSFMAGQVVSVLRSQTHVLALVASGAGQIVVTLLQRGHQLVVTSAGLVGLFATKLFGRTRMLFDWMGVSYVRRDRMEP